MRHDQRGQTSGAAAYESNAQSLIDVQTSANKVKQAQQQRKEIDELNEALNKAGDQYVMLKAVEKGEVKFWVIPQGQSVTLAPQP